MAWLWVKFNGIVSFNRIHNILLSANFVPNVRDGVSALGCVCVRARARV